MKKYLYGTTSLVGVGLLAGASPVQAEPQPIHLQLGGFFHQWQGIVDTDQCQGGGRKSDCNGADIVQVGEIFFNIRGELDNGLEIGGLIELETQQDSDVIDAARVDIMGPFGHVQLGQEDSARHNWAFDTAAPNEGILINSGWETAFAATSQNSAGLLRPTHSTALDFSDKAPKVTYFTPRLNGFQFAASWTPDTQTALETFPVGNASDGNQGSLQFGTANEEETYTNAIDLGVHYSGEFQGVGVTAQAGWGTVDTPDNLSGADSGGGTSDPNIYQAGLAISLNNFTVAGGWARMDHGLVLGGTTTDAQGNPTPLRGEQRTDGYAWTIGAGYTTGPWAFSAGYLHGEEEGATELAGRDENDFYQVSVSYALSPGLGVNLQYLHINREADQEGCVDCGNDSDTDAVMLGVKVGF
jgi:predicted porin